jgi:hypothetical protein
MLCVVRSQQSAFEPFRASVCEPVTPPVSPPLTRQILGDVQDHIFVTSLDKQCSVSLHTLPAGVLTHGTLRAGRCALHVLRQLWTISCCGRHCAMRLGNVQPCERVVWLPAEPSCQTLGPLRRALRVPTPHLKSSGSSVRPAAQCARITPHVTCTCRAPSERPDCCAAGET